MRTRFRITSVDYEPEDLAAQVPFDGVLLRKVAGPDQPDYWLAELAKPLHWADNGVPRKVTHIVLAARYEGETIETGFQRLVVGLAYVTDDTHCPTLNLTSRSVAMLRLEWQKVRGERRCTRRRPRRSRAAASAGERQR